MNKKTFLFLFFVSLFYSWVNFPGIELTTGYHGNVFQTIHPDSFPNDDYMTPNRPAVLSSFYLLVKLMGSIWLDDRFVLLVYFGLVFGAFFALDKLVQFMDISDLWGRMFIAAIMFIEHPLTDTHAMLVGNKEFSPTCIAAALIPWFFYRLLAQRSLGPTFLLFLAMASLSPKTAWFPFLLGFAIVLQERFKSKGRAIAIVSLIFVCTVGLIYYYLFLRPPGDAHPTLFNYIVNFDNSEGNPFMDTLKAQLLIVSVMILGYGVPISDSVLRTKIRIIAIGGFTLWLLSGLYFTYAPDFLKIPQLSPLHATRALWTAQYPIFVAIAVYLVKALKNAPDKKRFALFLLLTALFYASPFSYSSLKPAAVFAFTLLLGIVFYKFKKSRWTLNNGFQLVAIAICCGSLAFAVTRGVRRLDAYAFLLKHGIMGDNIGAQWLGVNEFFRDQTPPTATVMALTEGIDAQGNKTLGHACSLRSRSGKTMVLGHVDYFLFDHPRLLKQEQMVRAIDEIAQNWKNNNVHGIKDNLQLFNNPNYLVISSSAFDWLNPNLNFGYKKITEINRFAIFQRER